LLLFRSDRSVIQLRQIWQNFKDVLAILRVLANWVVPEPEHFQVSETLEVLDVLQILDRILAQIKFSQLATVLEISQ